MSKNKTKQKSRTKTIKTEQYNKSAKLEIAFMLPKVLGFLFLCFISGDSLYLERSLSEYVVVKLTIAARVREFFYCYIQQQGVAQLLF